MKKFVLFAVALLAVSSVASATNVVLVAHNLRSAGGALSTLAWKSCPGPTYPTPCVNPANAWVQANGITGSNATWDWNPDTGVLTGTGRFESSTFISSNNAGSSILADKAVNLVIDTANDVTSATSYACIEGTFLASVGANGCGGYNLGDNFVNDSMVMYNVGGNGQCLVRTMAGDDTVTGNARGVTNVLSGGGCDATAGAFNLWTVVQDDDVEGGTLIISNGVCQVCPNVNYLTFQYAVGPSSTDDAVATALNTPVVIDVLGNDNGFADPVTVSLFAAPAQGSVAITGSPGPQAGIVLTYTPAPGFRGVETFQYAIDDGAVSDVATVTVSVGLAPAYNPAGPQTGVSLSTITSGGWKQCYSATMGTPIGSGAENVLSACKGNYLMMAGRSTGSDTFLVLATAPYAQAILNTGGNSNTHLANGSNWYFTPSHSWGFTAANDTVNLNSCDFGGSSPTSMCLHTSSGDGGYRINDISSLNSSTAYEKVFFVEQIPGAYDDAQTAYLSTPVNIKVLANDVGFGSPVTVSIDDAPDNGSAVVNGSPGDPLLVYVTYTPAPGFEGVDTFQYSVGDGALQESATVTVTVMAPQALPDSAISKNATPAVINVLANDTGFSDPVTVTVTAEPSNGTAVVTGSPGPGAGIRITYTPAAGFTGQDSLQYQVSDGVNSATAAVSLTVTAFKAVNDTFRVLSYDNPYLYVGLNDIGFKDPVTLTILTGPTVGSAHTHDTPGPKSGVLIHYSPNYGTNYTTTMTYQLSDGVNTDTATVTVHVVQYYAQDDERNTGVGIPVVVPVTSNDVGFDFPRTVGLYTNPQHGHAVANNPGGCCSEPTITYTPAPGFIGDDTFEYAIDDGTRIAIARVTVHVINDADNDLVSDSLDNCLGTANADQRDADGDGYGSLCDADYNNDRLVNFGDLAMFRATFGSPNANADMDGNGVVNFADLSRFKALFGKAPGPSALQP